MFTVILMELFFRLTLDCKKKCIHQKKKKKNLIALSDFRIEIVLKDTPSS